MSRAGSKTTAGFTFRSSLIFVFLQYRRFYHHTTNTTPHVTPPPFNYVHIVNEWAESVFGATAGLVRHVLSTEFKL